MYEIKNSSSSATSLSFNEENSSYISCRNSGVLDFWDEPGEDIYTLEDGELI